MAPAAEGLSFTDLFLYEVSMSGKCVRHGCSLNGPAVLIEFCDSCADSQAIVVLLCPCVKLEEKARGVSEVC